jgi:hypothetical protein
VLLLSSNSHLAFENHCVLLPEKKILKASWWSCQWDETTSVNCGHQRAYCSTPKEIYDHGEPWLNDVDRGKLRFVHQSYLTVLPAVI